MTLRVVVDVNLSPEWVPVLIDAGLEAVHWAKIGDPAAPDQVLIEPGRSRVRILPL